MEAEKLDGGLSTLTDVLGLESASMDIADRLHGYAMLHKGMTPESWAMAEGRDEIIGLRGIASAQRDLITALEKVIARLEAVQFRPGAPVELPERPEPEDCESLSFDAYSGFQMLAYGRACAEAQRLMVPNASAKGPGGSLPGPA